MPPPPKKKTKKNKKKKTAAWLYIIHSVYYIQCITDHVQVHDVITFEAGQSEIEYELEILDDEEWEPDEEFYVKVTLWKFNICLNICFNIFVNICLNISLNICLNICHNIFLNKCVNTCHNICLNFFLNICFNIEFDDEWEPDEEFYVRVTHQGFWSSKLNPAQIFYWI